MPTRNVVLTDYHETVIAGLVESGRYQNASEVLREGLRLIEERESREKAKLRLLQEAVRLGFDDIAAGRFVELQHDEIGAFVENLGRSEPEGGAVS